MKIQGKVMVVTGAGNGIGRELTLLLLSGGARVAGVDLNAAWLEETRALAGANAAAFDALVANVADRAAVESLPGKVLARFGQVDGVINNAGIIQPFVSLLDLEYSAIERVFNVNFFGTLYMTKTFLPHLLKRPEAHIVNLSSMGGFLPVPTQTIYCAAKAAVKLMTEGLSSELEKTNVRVSIVFPGAVETNLKMNSGAHRPDSVMKSLSASEAARLVVQGMESDSYQIYVGKDSSIMSKLSRLSPSYAARLIARKMREGVAH